MDFDSEVARDLVVFCRRARTLDGERYWSELSALARARYPEGRAVNVYHYILQQAGLSYEARATLHNGACRECHANGARSYEEWERHAGNGPGSSSVGLPRGRGVGKRIGGAVERYRADLAARSAPAAERA